MNKLKNKEFEKILKMKQVDLKSYLESQLESAGYDPVSKDGFLFAKGSYPVLLVAHMDTVHKECVAKINYNGTIMSSPQGIGGDDRCGVFAILQLIKDYHCSVLFTEDEEIGCVGAEKFVQSGINIEINYIIEIDRRGTNDCVFYSCENPKFNEFIESTGYFKTQWGSLSDISIIAPALGVAAVNLSSGYFNEHTLMETINMESLLTIIEEIKKILALPCENPFEYIECDYGVSRGIWNGYWYDDNYDWGFSENYITEYTDDGPLLTSKEDKEKKVFHIYLERYTGETICCEVMAINKMEAIGMVLSHYQFSTVDDIVDIIA